MAENQALQDCANMLAAHSPAIADELALRIGRAVNNGSDNARADIVVALVQCLLAACHPGRIERDAEAAIELIRRAYRKEAGKKRPS